MPDPLRPGYFVHVVPYFFQPLFGTSFLYMFWDVWSPLGSLVRSFWCHCLILFATSILHWFFIEFSRDFGVVFTLFVDTFPVSFRDWRNLYFWRPLRCLGVFSQFKQMYFSDSYVLWWAFRWKQGHFGSHAITGRGWAHCNNVWGSKHKPQLG
mgnify:CR=1 FL=1